MWWYSLSGYLASLRLLSMSEAAFLFHSKSIFGCVLHGIDWTSWKIDWLIDWLIDCQWCNDRLLYWIQFIYVCHHGTFLTMLVKLKEGICDNSGWKMIITMPTSDEVIVIFLSRLKNFTSTSINQTLRIFIKLISIDYYKKLF